MNLAINGNVVGSIPLYLELSEWNNFDISIGPLGTHKRINAGLTVKLTKPMSKGFPLISVENHENRDFSLVDDIYMFDKNK